MRKLKGVRRNSDVAGLSNCDFAKRVLVELFKSEMI